MISIRSTWEVLGQYQFYKIFEISVRLYALAVQSATVEHVHIAHIVIYIKLQNRLKVRYVNMLLFWCINLRLLNKDNAKIGDFLEEVILDGMIEEMMAGEESTNLDDVITNSNSKNELESSSNKWYNPKQIHFKLL